MNPCRGSKMSPAFLSFCRTSSTSVSPSPFSLAVFMTSSIGIVFPNLFSSSAMISLTTIILFRCAAGISVAILSMSMVPVFSSNATCRRQ